MNRKSRILSLILVAALILGSSSFTGIAAEPGWQTGESHAVRAENSDQADILNQTNDSEDAGDAENADNANYAGDADDADGTEDAEDAGDAGDADYAGDADDADGPDDTDDAGDAGDSDDADDADVRDDSDDEMVDDNNSDGDTDGKEVRALNIKVTLKDNVLTVRCRKVSGTYRYQIYRMDGSHKTVVKKSGANTYSIKIKTGIIYKVSVTAETKKYTYCSKAYKVCKPAAVTSVKTLGRSRTSVRIFWKASKKADQYLVYQKNLDEKNPSYKLVKRVEHPQATVKVSYNTHYRYKIIPVFIRNDRSYKGDAVTVLYSNMQIVSTDHQKYSYEEMVIDIQKLSKKYSGMVKYKSLGTSYDGRKIYDVIVGNPKAKKCMVIEGTIHAREYMATLLMMAQIEYYMEHQTLKVGGEKIEDTLEDVCIHFVPMINPDGVTISQEGIRSIRNASLRKKLSGLAKGSTKSWKSNARGVDLNRNWNYKWYKFGKAGSGGYSGTSAESERETRALAKLKRSLKSQGKLKAVISYHTIGNIIFSRATGASKTVQSVTNQMYAIAHGLTGYGRAEGVYTVENDSAGNSQEWDWYVLKVPSLSIEVGSKTAPGPISEFPVIWNANKNVVIREAQLF